MKKTALLIIFLIFSIAILSGCSSNEMDYNERQGRGFRGENLTEEERQQKMIESGKGRGSDLIEEDKQEMFEERQQKAIEACQGKTEGDICILQDPMGEMESICKTLDDNLLCAGNRAMRQR